MVKMKDLLFTCLLSALMCNIAQSQTSFLPDQAFKLTGGRIILGTGDIFGYSANVEWTKKIGDKKNAHFAWGAEISLEHASTHPTVINPTAQEFLFGPIYMATTNIVLSSRISYYPFARTFAKGINITGGVCAGNTSQDREFQATRIYDSTSGSSVRRSYLEFINKFLFGYKITAGYEWYFKKIMVGARLDFASYTNGDINTFYGLKLGWSLL
ncbi:MAG: hypothetical protein ACJ75B_16880 [Flavisolibacter sp.]